MKIKFPPFLKKNPFELFDKVQTPVLLLVIIGSICLRAWQFGRAEDKNMILLVTLISFYALLMFIFILFFSLGGSRLSQLSRLVILYQAFVPKLKLVYLQRITDIKLLFELREDLTNGRTKNAIALWYPEISQYLLLMVPFIIVIVMAMRIGNENIGELKIFKPSTLTWGGVVIVLSLMALFFGNFANLGSYIISTILVCCIWKLWEQMRIRKSYEPMPVVAWAEMLLFLAMLLKGIVESF